MCLLKGRLESAQPEHRITSSFQNARLALLCSKPVIIHSFQKSRKYLLCARSGDIHDPDVGMNLWYTGELRVVELLLKEGADPDLEDEAGQTPLHWAACVGHAAVIAKLMTGHSSPGAAANKQDAQGWTPLHHAANHGARAAVVALLQVSLPVLHMATGHQKTSSRDSLAFRLIYHAPVTPYSPCCAEHMYTMQPIIQLGLQLWPFSRSPSMCSTWQRDSANLSLRGIHTLVPVYDARVRPYSAFFAEHLYIMQPIIQPGLQLYRFSRSACPCSMTQQTPLMRFPCADATTLYGSETMLSFHCWTHVHQTVYCTTGQAVVVAPFRPISRQAVWHVPLHMPQIKLDSRPAE